MRVVGKKLPNRMFELIAYSTTSLSSDHEKALTAYAAGLEAYRQQFWHDAIGDFRKCMILLSDDGPAWTMADRCETYQDSPAPRLGQGVRGYSEVNGE